jgi:hypothetical protein
MVSAAERSSKSSTYKIDRYAGDYRSEEEFYLGGKSIDRQEALCEDVSMILKQLQRRGGSDDVEQVRAAL